MNIAKYTPKIVVTRHPALVDFLIEKELVEGNVTVVQHATADVVYDKHVFGVLPNHLACEAFAITEVALNIPVELRGKELSLDQVREFATGIHTYTVKRVNTVGK